MTDFILSIKQLWASVPVNTQIGLFAVLVGLSIGLVIYLLGDLLAMTFYRVMLSQQRKSKKGETSTNENVSLLTNNGMIYHPFAFREAVTEDDLTGMSKYSWDMLQSGALGLTTMLAVTMAADPLMTGAQVFAATFGAFYGFKKFIRHLYTIQARKDSIDMMYMLQEELVVQRNSLTKAMLNIKDRYIEHVLEYGKKSWYYKNFVLSRMVYLVSTQSNFVSQEVLVQIGEELGDIDSVRMVMTNAMSRIDQTGDAGAIVKEQIESFCEVYYADLQESIPRMSDQLFVPIMLTHFMPFMVMLMWPMVEIIYSLMGGDIMSGDTSAFPDFFMQ